MNDNIIEKVVDFIQNMELGDSNSVSSILRIISSNEFSTEELFDIQEKVIIKCEEQGILLDYSKYNGAVVGLPFNLDFIKKGKNNKKMTTKKWNKEDKNQLAKKFFWN